MTIKVEVPDNIVTVLRGDYGYSKIQCENIFKTYLTELMSDLHNEFEASFYWWLEEQEEEVLNQIKQGKQL